MSVVFVFGEIKVERRSEMKPCSDMGFQGLFDLFFLEVAKENCRPNIDSIFHIGCDKGAVACVQV